MAALYTRVATKTISQVMSPLQHIAIQSFMPLCDVHRVVTFRLTSARRVISVEPRLAFAALGVMARCSALARRFRSAALRYE